MIGYLRGAIAHVKSDSSRKSASSVVTVDVQGVGYDVQVTASTLAQLSTIEPIQLFTHLQVREDLMVLFGFASAAERDLFRQLTSVSGIGSQVAMALLNTLGLQDLVKAIVTGNIRVLSLTPGVGQKTAERLALELKSKLADWRLSQGGAIASVAPAVQEDVEMTLLALGYTPQEINAALQAIARSPELINNQDVEVWLKATISWLSQT
jgi:holliday junction DNA helicase RuvA